MWKQWGHVQQYPTGIAAMPAYAIMAVADDCCSHLAAGHIKPLPPHRHSVTKTLAITTRCGDAACLQCERRKICSTLTPGSVQDLVHN